MNNLQELVSHGIEKSTAINMLDGYSKRIGTMNGIYCIKDIEYDFSSKGKIVTLQCSKCGKTITRVMINGRNKWSELIKTCECQKEAEKQRKILEKKKEQRKLLESRVGEIHGDYTIASISNDEEKPMYTLKCNTCGAEKEVSALTFDQRTKFHCTKHYEQPVKFDDSYIGRKNNFLTIIGMTKNKDGKKMFLCRCDCGNIKPVKPTFWETGKIKSCGCKHDELISTHGGSNDRLYQVWRNMKGRCENGNRDEYNNYGGRGIKVCKEWHDYAAFKKWAYESGYDENAPFGECTIDRINVNGNYEPNNCRWISNVEQQKNKRPREETKNGGYRKFIILNGERISVKKACDMAGVNVSTFEYRVNKKGMSNEDALVIKEKNESSMRVRVNSDMRTYLFRKSQEENKTVSQIIRDLIVREMRKQ